MFFFFKLTVFFKLTTDQEHGLFGSQAHVKGQVVWKPINTNL